MEFVENEIHKLKVLMQNGFLGQDSFQAKAAYLREHGAVAEAGVGMTIAESHPFTVIEMRAGGPAEKTGVIKAGDELQKVDTQALQHHLTGPQVRALVIGPVGSIVELQFREMPRRTERGAYRVRLVRQAADCGGDTQVSGQIEMTPTANLPGGGVDGVIYNDDFTDDQAERAVKHHYDTRTMSWARTMINVRLEALPFAEGAMRKAFHMKDLGLTGRNSQKSASTNSLYEYMIALTFESFWQAKTAITCSKCLR